ncbi:MAG: pentapeptide repeat-containing protein [Planctomycetaceae bacterium]
MTDQPSPEARSGLRLWVICAAGLLLGALLTVNVGMVVWQLRSTAADSRQQAFWSLCHPGSSPDQRAADFLALVADGNAVWQSALLTDLSLPGTDLSGARLENARFHDCRFQKASFTDAVMTDAGMDLCDLTSADFSRARLRNVMFFKARLSQADFRNADLLSASLEQCTADRANFVAAKMGDAFLAMADLTEANFTGADLTAANLEAAVLTRAELALADFRGAILTDTDLTDSNWWRTRGLTSTQLDELTLAFPPSPSAPESRRRDFEIWLTRRIQDRERPTQDEEAP